MPNKIINNINLIEFLLPALNVSRGNFEKCNLPIIKNDNKIIKGRIILKSSALSEILICNFNRINIIEQIETAAIGLGNPIKYDFLLSDVCPTLNLANRIAPINTGKDEIKAKYKNSTDDS